MKKLTYLLGLGAIASLFLFNSCSEETLPAPSITFDAGTEIVLAVGETDALLTGTIVAEAKLDKVVIYEVTDLSETQLVTITDFNSGAITTTDDMNYSFRFTVTALTQDVQIKIEATDKDDQFASKSINIVVSAGNPIDEFTAVLMGAQGNLDIGSYLDAVTGTVYKQAAAESNSADIDIVYYFGSTNEATLTAPDDATVNGGAGNLSLCVNFTQKNPTRFASTTLSSAEFDAIENDASIVGISTSASKMTKLGVNDVIAFETFDGKKGLIKVAALNATNEGTITIDVKIQQ